MKLGRQIWVLAGIGLVDLISTVWLLRWHGAAEANPLMARFLVYGTSAFIVAKLIFMVVPLGVLEWARRRKPRFVARATNVAIAAYVLIYMVGVARANMVTDIRKMEGALPQQKIIWAQIQENIRLKRSRMRAETGVMFGTTQPNTGRLEPAMDEPGVFPSHPASPTSYCTESVVRPWL